MVLREPPNEEFPFYQGGEFRSRKIAGLWRKESLVGSPQSGNRILCCRDTALMSAADAAEHRFFHYNFYNLESRNKPTPANFSYLGMFCSSIFSGYGGAVEDRKPMRARVGRQRGVAPTERVLLSITFPLLFLDPQSAFVSKRFRKKDACFFPPRGGSLHDNHGHSSYRKGRLLPRIASPHQRGWVYQRPRTGVDASSRAVARF
jgi:hypothetical protein